MVNKELQKDGMEKLKGSSLSTRFTNSEVEISSRWVCTGWNKIFFLWLETHRTQVEMRVIFEENRDKMKHHVCGAVVAQKTRNEFMDWGT